MILNNIIRYNFLAAGMLAITLASCSEKEVPVAPNGYDRDEVTITHQFGKNLAGRVTVDGVPRAGVVVSDGINVELTDEKGEYQMYTTRQHVFVSVPEDCEIPVLDGLPRFYKVLDFSVDAKIQRDFNLLSAPKKTEWTLMAVADPQIGNDQDVSDFSEYILSDFSEFTQPISENTYGISLGDIVWNKPELFSTYKTLMGRTPVPSFSVIGNHDHNESVKNDTESDADFRNVLGPTYYSVNIGDYHMVVLDDVLYSGETGRNDYANTITQEQLDWLEKDLSHVSKEKGLIVALHIPTARWNRPDNLTNTQALYDLIKDFDNIQIISGHAHNQSTVEIAPNMTEYNFAAAMGAYWYPLCSDGTPRGYGVLKFNGNKLVDVKYKSAGFPDDYQMKLYAPKDAVLCQPSGNVGDPFDQILVNVFAWYPKWTVEIQEDGGSWKTLSNVQAQDPDVRKSLVYDEDDKKWYIPSNHNGAQIATTNHMFLYRPASDWRSVTVRATDPFGNVYTSTLDND
ncbi:MAG: calcineurin-like phosphoesterase family protein [Muribaculaceae bacterium]|nr:calcineurin-like phosphoesterase family protein [Muribaculaceae bacterium]